MSLCRFLLALCLCCLLCLDGALAAKTTVTLVMEFDNDTEDVSAIFKTEVVVGQTSDVVFQRDFDSFPESAFQQQTFSTPIQIEENTLYRLEIRQRFDSTGLKKYTLYKGTDLTVDNIMFTDSFVGSFEGNYAIIENSATLPSPPPTKSLQPSSVPSFAPTPLPTLAPVPDTTSAPTPEPTLAPTPAPTPAPVASPAQRKPVLLEVTFAENTEDVSFEIKSMVPVGQQPEVVFSKGFDSLPESTYQNQVGQVTLQIWPGTTYTITLEQRFTGGGVKKYSLYEGTAKIAANLLAQKTNMESQVFSSQNFAISNVA